MRRSGPKSATYFVEVLMGGTHSYNFKITLPVVPGKPHAEFGVLHGKGSDDARLALSARIPSVSRNAGLAAQSIVPQKFVLPEMTLYRSATAPPPVRETRFASEEVASGITFREMQLLLNTPEGRAEARRIAECELELPSGSDIAHLLEAAQKRAESDARFAALFAIIQALM
jgi:hypothetical protein